MRGAARLNRQVRPLCRAPHQVHSVGRDGDRAEGCLEDDGECP